MTVAGPAILTGKLDRQDAKSAKFHPWRWPRVFTCSKKTLLNESAELGALGVLAVQSDFQRATIRGVPPLHFFLDLFHMSMPFPEQAPRPPLFPKFSSVFGKVDAGRKFALGFLAAVAGVALMGALLRFTIEWVVWSTPGSWYGETSRFPFTPLCDSAALLLCLFNLRNRRRSWLPAILVVGFLLLGLYPLVALVVRVLLRHPHSHLIQLLSIFNTALRRAGMLLLHLSAMLAIRRLPWLGHDGSWPGGEQEMPPAESPEAGEMR
jgi:hypothetical protein